MNPTAERVDIRPVVIKSKTLLQCVTNDGRQATTRNIDFADLALKEFLDSGFANITVESKSGSISIRVTKKEKVLVSYQSKPFLQDLQHDREKERLLNPSFRARQSGSPSHRTGRGAGTREAARARQDPRRLPLL